MASPQKLPIELSIRSDHPDLLRGLDQWLQLGLISETQVLRIARSLSCNLPTQPQVVPQVARTIPRRLDAAEVLAARGDRPTTFINETPTNPPPTDPTAPEIPQILTALMAELSVLWLLLLGVFMVVVSSAVLAATQWDNFSAIGQYLILFLYTLAFGFAGLWCSHQPKLQLTGRMLRVTTLLIIPVNFWTMDGFQLWRYPLGWIAAIFTAGVLSVLNFRLLKGTDRLTKINSLVLPWLQWGWGLPGMALLLTYLGTVGTTGLQAWQARKTTPDYRAPGTIAILFASLLLMARAVLAQGIDIGHLGLALAMMGGLLCWLDRTLDKPLWQGVGWSAIGLGWLVSFMPQTDAIAQNIDPLWQTLGISGIALGLLIERLKSYGESSILVALWLVGLQTYSVMRVIFPMNMRQSIMAQITTWADLQAGAWEMTGLGFLGYGAIALFGSLYLRRRQMVSLALLNEQLTLGLGIVMMVPGLFNPLVRAIYFTVFSVGLGGVLATRRSRFGDWADEVVTGLGLLMQGTGVLALLSWGYWLLPDLEPGQWGWVFLIGALGEWGLALRCRDRFWQRAAWYVGMALATAAYLLMWPGGRSPLAGLPWLGVPVALTGLGYRGKASQADTNFVLATAAMVAGCGFGLGSQGAWLVVAGVGTIVMALVSLRFVYWPIALLTLLYGVSGVMVGYDYLFNPVTPGPFLGVLVGCVLGLWGLRQGSARFGPMVGEIYRWASDGLATVCALLAMGWIGVNLGIFGAMSVTLLPNTLGATLGLSAAIGYRQWQRATNLGWLGLVGCSMLLVEGLVQLGNWSGDVRAIAFLALGYVSLVAGDGWKRRRDLPRVFDAIPLLYGALGVVVAHGDWSSYTGCYSLVGAGLALGVGRRELPLKWMSYLGLGGVSIGGYELLFYQLGNAPRGGEFGDAVVLLGALGTLLGLVYRVLGRSIARFLRLETSELAMVAQLHWLIGGCLTVVALLLPMSLMGEWWWIAVAVVLGVDAIARARNNSQGAGWVYAGVLALGLALGRYLLRVLPDGVVLGWGGVMAGVIALGIDRLPWGTWGWESKPWRRVSQVLPGLAVLLGGVGNYIPSLLLTGGVYGLLALWQGGVWLSYVGLGLVNWGGMRWLWERGVEEPLFYVALVSGSLIYVTHVEAGLQADDRRETRHWLRMLAVGAFCGTAFYEVGMASWGRSLLTVGLGLVVTLVGIGLRTRAYLYVGTLVFVLAVLRQLWLFIQSEALLLWILGIGLGMVLIWVAATFEARRSQTIAMLQSWANELDRWA